METDDIKEFDTLIDNIKKYELADLYSSAYEKLADLFYYLTEYSKAFAYYFDSFDNARISGQEERYAYLFNKLGKCKLKSMEYDEALTFLNKGYTYAVINNDSTSKKNIVFNMALVNKKLGRYSDAVHLISEYLAIADPERERTNCLSAILLKGNCYIDSEEYEMALIIYNDLLKEIGNSEEALRGSIYQNIGLINYKLKQYDEALVYFDKSEVIKRYSDKRKISHALISKSRVYLELKDNENCRFMQ